MVGGNGGVPVRQGFRVHVRVCVPLVAPSVTFAVPERVTVYVSLSVLFTVPLPVSLTVALLLVSTRLELNDSGPSTNWSSTAVTVIVVVAPLVAPLANEVVLAV